MKKSFIFTLVFSFSLFLSLCVVAQPFGPVSDTFNYTGTFETFTVPAGVSSLTITACGAQGGAGRFIGDSPGGLGAEASASFSVTPGSQLTIIVGQLGGNGVFTSTGGGGGGGSFVVDENDNLLLAAGGGSGGGQNFSGNAGIGFAGDGSGGTSIRDGAGGAGFNTNGQDGDGGATGGRSFANGFGGGNPGGGSQGVGGFGGGGGGFLNGGGGGGYDGGDVIPNGVYGEPNGGSSFASASAI